MNWLARLKGACTEDVSLLDNLQNPQNLGFEGFEGAPVGKCILCTWGISPNEEAAVLAWLATIGETDPATIAEVLTHCRADPEGLRYYLGRAAQLPEPAPIPDDRRTCRQCLNLAHNGACLAAKRGEFPASRSYTPDPSLPRRCEGYAPGPEDCDRRPGRERWPRLVEVAP